MKVLGLPSVIDSQYSIHTSLTPKLRTVETHTRELPHIHTSCEFSEGLFRQRIWIEYMVRCVRSCNPCTWEVEAKASQVPGQFAL